MIKPNAAVNNAAAASKHSWLFGLGKRGLAAVVATAVAGQNIDSVSGHNVAAVVFALEISVFTGELCGLACEFNCGFFAAVVTEGVDTETSLMELHYDFLYDGHS